jgi:hypothetical protein
MLIVLGAVSLMVPVHLNRRRRSWKTTMFRLVLQVTGFAVNHALDRLLLVFPFCHPDVAGALAHTEH